MGVGFHSQHYASGWVYGREACDQFLLARKLCLQIGIGAGTLRRRGCIAGRQLLRHLFSGLTDLRLLGQARGEPGER